MRFEIYSHITLFLKLCFRFNFRKPFRFLPVTFQNSVFLLLPHDFPTSCERILMENGFQEPFRNLPVPFWYPSGSLAVHPSGTLLAPFWYRFGTLLGLGVFTLRHLERKCMCKKSLRRSLKPEKLPDQLPETLPVPSGNLPEHGVFA